MLDAVTSTSIRLMRPMKSATKRLAGRFVSVTPDKELDCGQCEGACPYGAIREMRAVRTDCLYCARCYESCPREIRRLKLEAKARAAVKS
mgnify:CR=1 FL=1